jgi:hypothetical protein
MSARQSKSFAVVPITSAMFNSSARLAMILVPSGEEKSMTTSAPASSCGVRTMSAVASGSMSITLCGKYHTAQSQAKIQAAAKGAT